MNPRLGRSGQYLPTNDLVYTPDYWLDPVRVARYYNVVQAMAPGWQAPDWLDTDKLEQAYNYYSYANQNKPWYEWQPLAPDDPGRTMLTSMMQPPTEMRWPGEQPITPAPTEQLATEAPPGYAEWVNAGMVGEPPKMAEQVPLTLSAEQWGQMQEQVQTGALMPLPATPEPPNPALGGLTQAEFDAQPKWKQSIIQLLSSPSGTGAVIGATMASPALVTGLPGILAVAGGAMVGYALGAEAEANPTLAKMLMYLDMGAEAIERTAGSVYQVGGSVVNPEQFGSLREVLSDLNALWKSSGLIYEAGTVGLTPLNTLEWLSSKVEGRPYNPAKEGEVWTMGSPVPVKPEIGTGWDAVVWARRQLAEGRSPQEVKNYITQQEGMSGQVEELIMHVIADPLNMTGKIQREALGTYAKGIGNVELMEAVQGTRGGLVETATMYGKLVGENYPAIDIGKMDAVTRWLAQVNKAGEYLPYKPGYTTSLGELSHAAGAVTTGVPLGLLGYLTFGPVGGLVASTVGGAWGWKMGWNYLANLTPQSKATEAVNDSATILALIMERARDDPETMAKYLHSLAATPHELASDLSMASINSAEASAIPLFLRDALPAVDTKVALWQATRWQADMIENMAKVLGMKPEEVLSELSGRKASDLDIILRQYIDKAREAAAKGDVKAQEIVKAYDAQSSPLGNVPAAQQLNGKTLGEIAKIFTGENPAPRTAAEFRQELYLYLMDKASAWSADWFKVKPDPTWARVGATVKAAQSLAVLAPNPTYLANNTINNYVSMAAEGVLSFDTAANMSKLWDRVGVNPPRLKQGFGPAALGSEFSTREILKAAQQPGFLSDVQKLLRQVGDKVPNFSTLSMRVEQLASAQATTSGFKQFWARMWKPGRGFQEFNPAEEAQLRLIHPDLPEAIYRAVQGGLNKAEIESAIFEKLGTRDLDMAVPEVVKRMEKAGVKVSEDEVRDVLQGTGVYEVLNEKLKATTTPEEVHRAFREVEDQVNGWIDERSAEAARAQAAQTAAQVKTEGFAGVVQVWDKLQLDVAEAWHKHFVEWEDTFARANADPKHYRELMQAQRSASRLEWQRTWKHYESDLLGICDGLGFETPQARAVVNQFVEQGNSWRRFFEIRDQKYDEFFDTIFALPVHRTAVWNDLQLELQKLYENYSAEEVRLQGLMDGSFVEAFGKQFPETVEGARAWRDNMLNFYRERAGMMSRHRLSVMELPLDEKRVAWTKFLNEEYMPFLRQFFQAQIDGAHGLYGKGPGPEVPPMPMAGTPPPTPPPTQPPPAGPAPAPAAPVKPPAAPTAPTAAAPTPEVTTAPSVDIRLMASENGIHTADANGNPIRGQDIHILNAIKKFGGPEAAGYLSLAEVDGEVARKAFEMRDLFKKNGPPYDVKKQFTGLANLMTDTKYLTEGVTPGSDEHILNIIKAFGGEQAAGYTKLADVTPEVGNLAYQGWKNSIGFMKPLSEEVIQNFKLSPEELEQMNAGLYGPRANLKNIEPELGELVSEAIMTTARTLQDEMAGTSGKEKIQSKDGNFFIRASSNTQWYQELYNKGYKSRTSIEHALQRIIDGEDAIKWNDKTLARIKKLVFDRLEGKAGLPGDVAYLQFIGDEAGAAVALSKWLALPDFAMDETFIQSFGGESRFSRIWDLAQEMQATGKIAELDPLMFSLTNEATPQEVIATPRMPGVKDVLDGIHKLRDMVIEQERLQARRQELKASVEQGWPQLMAGNQRDMLHDMSNRIFGYTDEQAEMLVKVLDARARTWAKANGRLPQEWYAEHIGGMAQGAPGEGLYQFDQALIDRAVAEFGITTNPREAGYVLPDGRMLDFSRGTSNKRIDDHAAVGMVIVGSTDITGLADIRKFIRETGSIRLNVTGEMNVEIGVLPTPEQIGIINGIIQERSTFYYDILNPDGKGWYATGKIDNPTIPKLNEMWAEAYETFSPYKFEQGAKGAVEFLADNKAIIYAMQSPDVSTLVHEVGHIFRKELSGADLKIAEDWAGVKEGIWESVHEEKMARAFERYLAEGIAPVEGLRGVFEQFKRWLLAVYTTIKGSAIDVQITPEIRGVFDRLLDEGIARPTGQLEMFKPEETMPLFTGTPMPGQESVFRPAEAIRQETFLQPPTIEPKQAGEAIRAFMPEDVGNLQTRLNNLANEIKATEKGRTLEQIIASPYSYQRELVKVYKDTLSDLQNARQAGEQGGWFDTPGGQKRLFQSDESGASYQNGDGTTNRVRNDGQEQPAMGAMGATDDLQPTPPVTRIAEEGWSQQVRPMLSQLEHYLSDPNVRLPDELKAVGGALPPDVTKTIRTYLGRVGGEMADTKLAAIRYGEMRRDAALLNYGRRYGFDNVISMGMPYSFWYLRTALHWALRAIDKPSWMANYARLRQFQRNLVNSPGFPTRLKDKMRIPIPFLPDWMGGGIYVDPMKQVFPFEQLARPWEQRGADQGRISQRAEYILLEMQANEEISDEEAKAAAAHSGPAWQKALTQARMEIETETSNPFEFINLLMSWSMPLQWAYYQLKGQKEKINPLPLARLINNVAVAFGANKGRGYEKVLGLPTQDEFQGYRVDRMLGTMAAEGAITGQQAVEAMLQRTGPAFEEAQRRVAQTGLVNWLGAPFGADIFPEGEQEQRGLKDVYQKAIEAWKAGDDKAMQAFFDAHPEYEARLALMREPAERLKHYLIEEVWNRYNALPDLTKQQVSDQLGSVFQMNFLEKETRNYDNIQPETLAMWTKALDLTGGQGRAVGSPLQPGRQEIPQVAGAPQISLELATPEVTAQYQDYRNESKARFPQAAELLRMLYLQPVEQQDAFRAQYPVLQGWETWRQQYFAQHPEIVPYAISEDNKVYGARADVQALYYQYQAQREQQFPGVYDRQEQYFAITDPNEAKYYLARHPELEQYWTWRRAFMKEFPQMIPYLYSEEGLAQALFGEQQARAQVDKDKQAKEWELRQWVNLMRPGGGLPEIPPTFWTPAMLRQLRGNKYADQPLSAGAAKAITSLWNSLNRPMGYGEFVEYLLTQVGQ